MPPHELAIEDTRALGDGSAHAPLMARR
jgi:hypothetical protein